MLKKQLIKDCSPVLEYGSSVLDPQGVVLQEELESVQKRAARFVIGNDNYCYRRSLFWPQMKLFFRKYENS